MPVVQPSPPSSVEAPAEDARALLAALNPQQRFAVEYGAQADGQGGPLLIIAGAGTGKTDTLAHRVAHLVGNGADPQRILLLTFSRRAALEMERRAGRILARAAGGQHPPTLPWSGTFHSVGARLLRAYAGRIGLDPGFTIHDRSDAEDQISLLRHERGLDTTRSRFPVKATCLAIYSRAVNSEAPLAEVLRTAFPWCAPWEAELKALFAAYVAAKQAQHVLDYDDLLLYWAQMMAEAALAEEVGARFDHVLVDEYQDTNRLQATIVRALKPDGRGVAVVGDDAQSIYSFRAATVRNILEFPRQFALPAQVVTLERNYRSTQPILDAANAIIALAREGFPKDLWTQRHSAERPQLVTVADEADQARCVAEHALACREDGIALKAQAVLFRASSHSAMLELELARRDIPFVKFGGLRFLEAAHVKDVLSVLRWAENPRNRIAGFRTGRLLPGIGPATATRLLDALDGGRGSADRDGSVRAAGRGACRLGSLGRAFSPPPAERGRLAGGNGGRHPLVRAASRTPPRRPRRARGRPRAARADRDDVRVARTLPDRAHPRSAERQQRRGGRTRSGTTITSSCRPSTRPRARSGRRCRFSTSSTAAFRPTSPPAPARRSRRSGGSSTSR